MKRSYQHRRKKIMALTNQKSMPICFLLKKKRRVLGKPLGPLHISYKLGSRKSQGQTRIEKKH
jgi:hypothetical protein